MSLISEALKRARLEAARREGERRGTVYASAPAYLPRRRRPPAAALVTAGLAAGLLAGAGLYWGLRRGAPPAPGGPPPPSAVESAAAPAAAALEPRPAAAEPPPAATEPPPIPVPPPAITADPPPIPRPAPSVPSPAPRPAAPPPASAPVAGHTYSRAVELPGGKRLELDGIVASPTDPVVMMNRRLMAPGEVLEGYTLVRIEAKRVELRGPDGATFFISLR